MYIIIVYIYVFCIADIHPIVTADRHLKRPSTEVSTVAMRQKNTSVMGTLWLWLIYSHGIDGPFINGVPIKNGDFWLC